MFFFTITILNREIKRKNESKKTLVFGNRKLAKNVQFWRHLYNCYYSHTLFISPFFFLLLIVNAFLFYFCTSKLICVRVNMVCMCVCHNSKMNWDTKQTNVCLFSLSKRKKPRNKIYVYKNTVSHTHLLNHFGSFVFLFCFVLMRCCFSTVNFLLISFERKKLFLTQT